MNDLDEMLVAGREAYQHRDYSTARDRLVAARAASTARGRDLSGADLAALHDAAWWHGSVAESISTGADAYRALVGDHEVRLAAWVAIGVAVNHLLREEEEPGLAWLDRAAEQLAGQDECPEQGFLRYLTEVEASLDDPVLEPVVVVAREIRELGRRLGEPTLVACGDMGEGRALLRLGRVTDGLRLLDRAMLAVAAGELHPEWAGDLYSHMMSACDELGDLGRARRWTAATERWLAAMPTAVLFAGVCRIHRAQLHRMAGDWPRAARDAAQVGRDLEGISRGSVAEAHYLVGEINRLRGDHPAAETAYRAAHRIGRDPQPGLATNRTIADQLVISEQDARAPTDLTAPDTSGERGLRPLPRLGAVTRSPLPARERSALSRHPLTPAHFPFRSGRSQQTGGPVAPRTRSTSRFQDQLPRRSCGSGRNLTTGAASATHPCTAGLPLPADAPGRAGDRRRSGRIGRHLQMGNSTGSSERQLRGVPVRLVRHIV
jgi:hypothetical protein